MFLDYVSSVQEYGVFWLPNPVTYNFGVIFLMIFALLCHFGATCNSEPESAPQPIEKIMQTLNVLFFVITLFFESYGLLIVSFYSLSFIRENLTSIFKSQAKKEGDTKSEKSRRFYFYWMAADIGYRFLAAILLNFILVKEGRHNFSVDHTNMLYAAQVIGFVVSLGIVIEEGRFNEKDSPVSQLREWDLLKIFYGIKFGALVLFTLGTIWFLLTNYDFKQVNFHAEYTFETYNAIAKQNNFTTSRSVEVKTLDVLKAHPQNAPLLGTAAGLSILVFVVVTCYNFKTSCNWNLESIRGCCHKVRDCCHKENTEVDNFLENAQLTVSAGATDRKNIKYMRV